MEQVNIIGIDLAKRSFHLHGARADGSVAFRRKVSREGTSKNSPFSGVVDLESG